MHCVRTPVMLKSLSKSSFDLCRASIISFSFLMFMWATYLVTFRIEMTWTRVSCCFVSACISWFMCCLTPHASHMVALPVSHYNASPGEGNRLLLDDGLSESVSSNSTPDHMVGL